MIVKERLRKFPHRRPQEPGSAPAPGIEQIRFAAEIRGHFPPFGLAGPPGLGKTQVDLLVELPLDQAPAIGGAEHPSPWGQHAGGGRHQQVEILFDPPDFPFVPAESRGIQHDPVESPAFFGENPQIFQGITLGKVVARQVEAVVREISFSPFKGRAGKVHAAGSRTGRRRRHTEPAGVGKQIQKTAPLPQRFPHPQTVFPLVEENPLGIPAAEADFVGQAVLPDKEWIGHFRPALSQEDRAVFSLGIEVFPPDRVTFGQQGAFPFRFQWPGTLGQQAIGKLIHNQPMHPVPRAVEQSKCGIRAKTHCFPLLFCLIEEICKSLPHTPNIADIMNTLHEKLDAAVDSGTLLAQSRENILSLLAATDNPVYHTAVAELADAGHWTELNDRFFRTLAFGTGGLRGRTIGRVVAPVEQGNGGPNGRPEHPCVGTNTMNFHNVSRAIQGMILTAKKFLRESGVARRPRLVFAHDTRHFSRDFAEFCAKVSTELGCDAWLFEADRSTPELSFAIRHLGADAGVVLTASHNPPHDNGFKAYFNDGAQLVEPQATEVIEAVNAIQSPVYQAVPEEERGALTILGAELDEAYIARLSGLVLEPSRLADGPRPKIVFTTLHGTGGRIIPQALARMGCEVATVAAQDSPDGSFPTVASPNPENAEALQMGIEQAIATGADVLIGTDPDCDRMGVAARDANGQMALLTGNQIGSLLAYHRTRTLFQQGVLNDGNRERACLIKTFVTTELQSAIATHYGIGCVNTLTGFKYISAKLRKYEQAIPRHLFRDYASLSDLESRALRLEHSRYFIFGGEESYGYLGMDSVRDKDANGAAIMFVEMACYAMSMGLTVPGLLDLVYKEFGYFLEKNHSKTFEGAEGAAKIAALAASYADAPPTEADGSAVTAIKDFNRDTLIDAEGETIPKEKMLFVELADGRSFAVRPSGTEPKIKYYLFGKRVPTPGQTLSDQALANAKSEVGASLAALWAWLDMDISRRLG